MKKITLNNLAALVQGREMTLYQRSLAVQEFDSVVNYLRELEESEKAKPDVKASVLEKLKIAKKALNDIYNFDRDMEFEYGDPGERAMRALEAIDRIDGF